MRAVLERDFLSLAIRGRTFVFRALVAAVTAFVAFLVFFDNRALYRDRPDEAATLVFAAAGIALLSLLALLTPPAVVGSIQEERRSGTLPLVLAAPAGPTAFAAAKLVSRSMAVLTWALAAIVPLAVVTLFGGVGLSQVAELAMLGCGVVLELAAWGLWISSVTHRLATGTVLAYLIPFTRWVLTVVLSLVLVAPRSPIGTPVRGEGALAAWWTVAATTPLPGVLRMLTPGDYDRALVSSFRGPTGWRVQRVSGGTTAVPVAPPGLVPPPGFLEFPALLYLAFAVLSALLAAFAAGRRLATEAEPRTAFLARLIDRSRAARSPPDGGNPVAWKEGRLLNTGASRPLFYSVLALLAIGEVLYLIASCTSKLDGQDMMEMGLVLAASHSSLIGLVAVVAGAAAMAHERTTGSLDLLRASPLTPREILHGKVGGLLRGLGLLGLLPLAHLGTMAVAGLVDPVTAVLAGLLDSVYILFFCYAGTRFGISALRTGAAVTLGALFYGFFLVGIPLLAALAGGGFGWKGPARILFAGWPPATSYWFFDASLRRFHPEWAQGHWWEGQEVADFHLAAVLWACAVAGGVLASWLQAPRLLARRFARESEEG